MCTVSWALTEDGYELFCNRDERRSRQRALPPRRLSLDGVDVLTPIDADAGGSWLAVNHFGVTLCLLNRYRDAADLQTEAEGYRSRGLLVMDLAPAVSVGDVFDRLAAMEMPQYRPFTLLAAQPEAQPLAAAWNGRHLSKPSVAEAPLVSSSRDPLGVHQRRRRLWEEEVERATPEALEAFHRSHLPERGAISPCMHRSDARTVSLTRIRVGGERIELAYADGPPCRTALGAPLCLDRLQAADAA